MHASNPTRQLTHGFGVATVAAARTVRVEKIMMKIMDFIIAEMKRVEFVCIFAADWSYDVWLKLCGIW